MPAGNFHKRTIKFREKKWKIKGEDAKIDTQTDRKSEKVRQTHSTNRTNEQENAEKNSSM